MAIAMDRFERPHKRRRISNKTLDDLLAVRFETLMHRAEQRHVHQSIATSKAAMIYLAVELYKLSIHDKILGVYFNDNLMHLVISYFTNRQMLDARDAFIFWVILVNNGHTISITDVQYPATPRYCTDETTMVERMLEDDILCYFVEVQSNDVQRAIFVDIQRFLKIDNCKRFRDFLEMYDPRKRLKC